VDVGLSRLNLVQEFGALDALANRLAAFSNKLISYPIFCFLSLSQIFSGSLNLR
jgi:hypothetical protein